MQGILKKAALDGSLSSSNKSTLLAIIALRQDAPLMADLCKATGLSRQPVIRALRELHEAGYIEMQERQTKPHLLTVAKTVEAVVPRTMQDQALVDEINDSLDPTQGFVDREQRSRPSGFPVPGPAQIS